MKKHVVYNCLYCDSPNGEPVVGAAIAVRMNSPRGPIFRGEVERVKKPTKTSVGAVWVRLGSRKGLLYGYHDFKKMPKGMRK